MRAHADVKHMHMCIAIKECKIRKHKVRRKLSEWQTWDTQMAVKNVQWFMGEVIHTFSHHVESKKVRLKI